MAKMWAGRTDGATEKIADDFNSSIHFDSRMYRQDITGSMAHAAMLGAKGIITCDEADALIAGLEDILADLESGRSGIPTLFSYSAELRKDCFGRECLGYAASVNGGKDVIKYMKRLVRENAGNINKTVTSGGKTFTIKEVVEKYIEYLIRQAHMNAEESGDLGAKGTCLVVKTRLFFYKSAVNHLMYPFFAIRARAPISLL